MKKLSLVIFYFLILSGCTPEPMPIEFGHDSCHHCKMTIVDRRYGAELVTKKGKVYKYDAAECLINSVFVDAVVESGNIHSLWVVDFGNPENLTVADKCTFLHSEKLPSPMGMFLSAFGDSEKVAEAQKTFSGELFNWKQTMDFVLAAKKPE